MHSRVRPPMQVCLALAAFTLQWADCWRLLRMVLAWWWERSAFFESFGYVARVTQSLKTTLWIPCLSMTSSWGRGAILRKWSISCGALAFRNFIVQYVRHPCLMPYQERVHRWIPIHENRTWPLLSPVDRSSARSVAELMPCLYRLWVTGFW